ncbi:hypothetical protein TKK_0003584 [Trichogramma kaykai]
MSIVPYADDTMILCKTKNIDQEKTKFIIFSKENYPHIEKKPLTMIKYLGMTMDHKLTWTPHINNIIGKASKITNVFKVLKTTWWDGNPHLLLTMNKSLIRSIIEYNSFITNSHKHSLAEKLQKIQNHSIRLAVGYRVSTALTVIHAKINILNLKTRNR